MTTYLVRLKPDAEPPADREATLGKVHILDSGEGRLNRGRGIQYAYMGAPTVCGRGLHVVAQVGEPWRNPWPSDRRAVLHFSDRVEVDLEAALCRGCFGPEPVARWSDNGIGIAWP